MALVAEVFIEGRVTVIAEARYVRRANRSAAEFAVSVAEPWQGKALASLILGKLVCRAASDGVPPRQHRHGNDRMLAQAQGRVPHRGRHTLGLMLLEKPLELCAGKHRLR